MCWALSLQLVLLLHASCVCFCRPKRALLKNHQPNKAGCLWSRGVLAEVQLLEW